MQTHPVRAGAAVIVTAGLLASALVAGCSKESAPEGAASSPTKAAATSTSPTSSSAGTSARATSGTPGTSPSPQPATLKLPADQRDVIEVLYGGGSVAATPDLTAVLAGRKHASLPVGGVVAGPVGSWKGTPVAVVKVKDDVTILVKGPSGWQVAGGWWPSLGIGPQLGGRRFVAVLGVDARPGQNPARTRADAIQVVGYDGKRGAGIVGVARDTWVTLPSGRQSKINAAMVEGGPTGMTGALRRQIGVPVDRYMYINFAGFKAMINAFGGVTVKLPYAVDTRVAAGVIPAGQPKLTGYEALALARTRKSLPRGDFQRSGHQSLILLGGALTATRGGVTGLPKVATTISKYVGTNLTAAEAMTFLALPYAVDLGTIGTGVSAGGFGWSSDGQSIVVAGPAERRLYADFRDGALTR